MQSVLSNIIADIEPGECEQDPLKFSVFHVSWAIHCGWGWKSTYEGALYTHTHVTKKKETLDEEYSWDIVLIGETDTELEE